MDKEYVIGVDIGATNVKLGVVRCGGEIVDLKSVEANIGAGPVRFMERLVGAIEGLISETGLNKDDIGGIGIGCPSWDGYNEAIGDAPNMPGFMGLAVGKIIEEKLGLPTVVDNDANAAADGERRFGGWGVDNIVVYTLGTGVGGGVIHRHPKTGVITKIVGGKFRGGELGHVTIPLPPGRDSRRCGCGHYDCLEAHASATAVKGVAREEVRRLLEEGKTTKILDMVEKDADLRDLVFKSDEEKVEYIEAKHVGLAAAEDDELAVKIEEQTAYALAQGIRNVVQTFDPEIVVIAGEMGIKWKRLVEKGINKYREMAGVVPAGEVRIEVSRLENAGVLGAAALVG